MSWKHLGVAILSVAILVLCTSAPQAAEKKARANSQQQFLDKMAEQLGLSADQKDQVKKIHDEYQEKINALEKERRAAVEKVLTPEQQTKMQELLKQRRGNRGSTNNNENNTNNKNNNTDNKEGKRLTRSSVVTETKQRWPA